MRILSGVQPSGALHLGNYFGALKQFVALQNDPAVGTALYFIADWHALTSVQDGRRLAELTREVALDYLALGLDPTRSVLFRQSDVPEHVQLMWILSTLTPMALMERAHSYKDKVAKGAGSHVGLFTYPILMAADILLYGPDRVPVGQDQKQHLEIARDLCTKFNATFVPGWDPNRPQGGILAAPEPLILAAVAAVPGLDGQKMSKSYGNTLPLFLPEREARKKIMGIVTDATPVEAPKPAGAVLLHYLTLLASPEEAAQHVQSWQAGGVGYGSYKKRLVELYLAYFAEARARRQALAADADALEAILRDGAERARALAQPRWDRIVQAVGCGRTLGLSGKPAAAARR